MSDEQTPDVEEIKARLKVEIPFEEEEPGGGKGDQPDLSAEFQKLGQQFAETIRTAWHSEERLKIETEIREGMKTVADEVSKALHEVKESEPAQKVKAEAGHLKEQVKSGEISAKARQNMAQGLNWLSQELAKLAAQFTPAEKTVEGEEE
jgi:cell division protein ZapA (FtsZ GTPase activity inhibitor)